MVATTDAASEDAAMVVEAVDAEIALWAVRRARVLPQETPVAPAIMHG